MKPFGIKSQDNVGRRPFQYIYSITYVRPLRLKSGHQRHKNKCRLERGVSFIKWLRKIATQSTSEWTKLVFSVRCPCCKGFDSNFIFKKISYGGFAGTPRSSPKNSPKLRLTFSTLLSSIIFRYLTSNVSTLAASLRQKQKALSRYHWD